MSTAHRSPDPSFVDELLESLAAIIAWVQSDELAEDFSRERKHELANRPEPKP